MPRFITPSGRTVYIPGVYVLTKIVLNLSTPLPEFHVPVIVGNAAQGVPYNVADLREDHEDTEWWGLYGRPNTAAEVFGFDSEIVTAMKWAARGGLSSCYIACSSALTRAGIIITSTGPVSELTLYPKLYGAPPSYTKIKWTSGGDFELTPVSRFAMLAQDATAGDTRIYVTDSTWLSKGQALEIGDNATANEAVVVKDAGQTINSSGQLDHWVDLEGALAGSFATAQYGLVAKYASQAVVSTSGITSTADLFEYLRATAEAPLDCTKEGTYTGANPVAYLASATPLKDVSTWGAFTAGTSPAATSTEHDGFITDLDGGKFDAFALDQLVVPRMWLIVESDSTMHASWRDWAAFMRATREIPVAIMAGTAWGDTSVGAGNDTSPKYRAEALNSQDFMLCAWGMDRLASYLSFAPYVFGLRCAGGVNHNLTGDELPAHVPEKEWDEINSGELTTLTRAGVCTTNIRLAGVFARVVQQGISTLQGNLQAWNSGDNTSPLVHQRDLADAVQEGFKDDLHKFQGADGVTPEGIAQSLLAKAQQMANRGWLDFDSFAVSEIPLDASGAGYNPVTNTVLPTTVDFIGLTNLVIVG